MQLVDAAKLVARLKAAFPRMTLDEEEMELVVREVSLLADPLVLNEAVDRIIRTSERFPTVAEIRSQYHAVVNAKRAATPALPSPPRDPDIPEWVQVWYWEMNRTRSNRQKANATSRQPVDDRAPVEMRDFPQYEHPGPDALTIPEYEALRDEWVAAGSPSISNVRDIFDKL